MIAPPRLIFPLSPLRVTSRQPRVVWELAPGTNGARVEFCRDRCCTQVIETVDALGTFASPAAMLPPGVVFWRARGRLGDRVGREVSFTWEFGVRRRSAPIDTAWGAIRDVNGDGYDDLATSLYGWERGHLRTYWGGVDGLSPWRQQTISLRSSAAPIAFGDFNGDGYADIATVGATVWGELRGAVMAAYGYTTGVRVEGPSMSAGLGTLAVTDINGDGFSDVVARLPAGPVRAPNFIRSSAELHATG